MSASDRSKTSSGTGVTRRGVLLAGAAAPALIATQASGAAGAPEGPTDHRQVVLQDTPHIRAYYDRVKG